MPRVVVVLSAIAALAPGEPALERDRKFLVALFRAGFTDLAERYVDSLPDSRATADRASLESTLAHQLARAAESAGDRRALLLHQAQIRVERYTHVAAIPAAVQLEALRARADVACSQARLETHESTVAADLAFGKADQALMDAHEQASSLADQDDATDPRAEVGFAAIASGLHYERAALNYDWALRSPTNTAERAQRLAHASEWAEEFLFASPEPGLDVPLAKLLCGLIHAQIWRDGARHDPEALRMALAFFADARDDPALGLISLLLDSATLGEDDSNRLATIAEQLACEQARLVNDAGTPEKAAGAREILDLLARKQMRRSAWRDAAELEQARAARLQGNSELAAQIATAVWKESPSPSMRQDAQLLLSDLAGSSSAAAVTPAMLLAAAEASMTAGDAEKALAAIHRGLLRLVSQRGRDDAELLAQFWAKAGDLYLGRRQPLQASIAFEEALRSSAHTGDEAEVWARGYYNALVMRAQQTGSAFDRQRQRAAADELSRLGLSRGANLSFFIAKERFGAAKSLTDEPVRSTTWREVDADFARVDATSAYFERAWVYRARIAHELGHLDEALRALAEYQQFTQRNRATPGSDRQRRLASAEAQYYHASWLVEVAAKSPANSQDRRTAIREALTELHEFGERHPEQPDLLGWVELVRLQAHALQEDLARCEEDYARLLSTTPPLELSTHAAFQLGNAYLERHRLSSQSGAEDLNLLHRAAELIFEHSRLTEHRDPRKLKRTGDWFFASGDLERAQQSYATLLAQPAITEAGDPELGDARLRFAQCLTRLGQLADAKKLWDDLVPKNPKSFAALEGAAMAEGGFLDVRDGQVRQVAGVGDPVKAVTLWRRLLRQGFADDTRTAKWWDTQVHLVYSLAMLGEQDASQRHQAQQELRALRGVDPNLGGSEHRPLFTWLEQRLQ